jgi:hypothetical protein
VKRLVLTATCLALSACTDAEKQKYNANVDCVANEHVRHDYIDQSYNPDEMFEQDSKIWRSLHASLWANARALDIPGEEINRHIVKRIGAIRAKLNDPTTGGITVNVVETERNSRTCMKRFGNRRGG